jgi:MYXO-CTERM domain-containing protein
MEEIAQRLKARMAFDAAGVEATIEPGAKLTVRVAKASTIPVTGLCTPAAEDYAGQRISYLQLGDGQSVTLSLADCNPDFGAAPTGGGAGDAGVAPDAGGASDPAGPTVGGNCPATGTGGAGGAGGATGEGGAGGDTTMGGLSTDAGTDRAYGDGGGCSCDVSGGASGRGAAAALIALVIAGARRRRRGGQASWAIRPSFSGRSIR